MPVAELRLELGTAFDGTAVNASSDSASFYAASSFSSFSSSSPSDAVSAVDADSVLPSGRFHPRLHPTPHATLELLGSADVSDGELALTRSASPPSTGSAWLHPASPHPPLTHFQLSFELSTGGGLGADGMSLVYAEPPPHRDGPMPHRGGDPTGGDAAGGGFVLPGSAEQTGAGPVRSRTGTGGDAGAGGGREPFGELGPFGASGEGHGLVLRLISFERPRIELRLSGIELASVPAPGLFLPVSFAPVNFSSAASFAPVNLTVHAARGVWLSIGGRLYLEGVPLPVSLWTPGPSWRIGLGARTGGSRSDHVVRRAPHAPPPHPHTSSCTPPPAHTPSHTYLPDPHFSLPTPPHPHRLRPPTRTQPHTASAPPLPAPPPAPRHRCDRSRSDLLC